MKYLFSSILVLVAGSVAQAVTTAKMIKEVESLYTAVAPKDSARPQLALRLADTLFDAAVEIGANTKATKEDFVRQESYRKKAIQTYLLVLNGFDRQFPEPQGELRAKIKFQLGRLFTDDGQLKLADQQWLDLVKQTDSVVIQREAALRLAEKLELSTVPKDLAKAHEFYNLAMQSADSYDLRSYVLYRRAWTSYRLKNMDAALTDLQSSLKEAKGTAIDEILRDTILFLSNSKRDPKEAVSLIESYATQYKKPELIENLSDAYFVADNSAAYVYLLEYQNQKQMDSLRLVRLMDSYYAARKWDLFHQRMMDLKQNEQKTAQPAVVASANESDSRAKISSAAEVEKVFHRLIIQLDGERTTRAERAPLFKEAADLFVALFPRSKEAAKVIDGWLAAEDSADAKLTKLQTWIQLANSLGNKSEEIRLRKIRAAVAVKAKNYAVVAEESERLNSVNNNYSEKRETNYQFARAQYELKNFTQALPVFQQLAMPVEKTAPDQWAILSQNLALDILASQKKYDDLISQTKLWTGNASILAAAKTDKKLAQEISDMEQTAEKTKFEKYISLGVNPESLRVFKNYCLEAKFLPKSCENAKILAVQMKDQATLLAVLKAQNNNDALVDELEFGGYFAEAADLLSKKLNAKSAINDWLKVALLYEIAGKKAENEKTLKALIANQKNSKTALGPDAQELFYLTLKDSNLLSVDLLAIQWSEGIRWRLLNDLQAAGRGTLDTKKQLLATCAFAGEEWNRLQIEKLRQLDQEQAQINFVGKNSQKNFNRRVYSLKALADAANCYMTGSGQAARAVTLMSLANSYREFTTQILNTPLPPDLDEATANAAKEQLAEMARPFGEQANKYQAEVGAQIGSIADSTEKVIAEDKIQSAKSWNFDGLFRSSSASAIAANAKSTEGDSILQGLLLNLKSNPYDSVNIGKIQEHLRSTGQTRMAGYFKGRSALDKKE